MTRQIDAATLAALDQDLLNPVVLIEFELDTPVRLVTGSRNYTVEGLTFTASGDVLSVGNTEEKLQLDPGSLNITLSGLKPAIIAAFGVDHINKNVNVFIAYRDSQQNIIGDPIQMFSGPINSLDITYGKSIKLDIQLKDELIFWSRPKVSRYTDAEQKRSYPNDKGFEFVESLSDREIEWP